MHFVWTPRPPDVTKHEKHVYFIQLFLFLNLNTEIRTRELPKFYFFLLHKKNIGCKITSILYSLYSLLRHHLPVHFSISLNNFTNLMQPIFYCCARNVGYSVLLDAWSVIADCCLHGLIVLTRRPLHTIASTSHGSRDEGCSNWIAMGNRNPRRGRIPFSKSVCQVRRMGLLSIVYKSCCLSRQI